VRDAHFVLNAPERRPGRPYRGRYEVKAFLSVEQRRLFDQARSARKKSSISRAVVEACMAWADAVLDHPGPIADPEPAPHHYPARRAISGWMTPQQSQRWSLAVGRSRLESGIRAATAAVLRWSATRPRS